MERDLLELLLWTPALVTSPGLKLDNGTIDHSVVLGTPPLERFLKGWNPRMFIKEIEKLREF